MLELFQWVVLIIFANISISGLVIFGCGKKKKADEPKNVPKYTMKAAGGPTGNSQSPAASTPQQSKNEKKPEPSKENKKSNKEGKKPESKKEEKKGPAKDAMIPALNKDHLIPQVKDPVKTERRDADGDGKKVVSNPIVSAVTEQFPTVAQPVKEEIKTDKTQSTAHTDKTQKD